jgi:hypothetical protein
MFEVSTYGLKSRNNSTVFEELKVSIVDLTVANAVLLFKELSMSVSIVDLTEYFFSGRNMKSAYILSFIGMFSN